MKKVYFWSIALLAIIAVALQLAARTVPAKEYVCLPCGRPCDSEIHHGPGTCPACSMALVEKETAAIRNISFSDVCSRLKANNDVLLLDCRSKEEFNNTIQHGEAFGRFKKAININVYELSDRLGELDAWKDKEVIVYCSHSHRSPQATYILSSHGFKNVKNVQGGVSTLQGDPGKDCLKDQFIFYPAK